MEEKKHIPVNDFIKAYNEAQQKDKYIKNHINNEYVSYFQKIAEAHKIVEFSMYKEVNGKKIFWKDSPSLFQLFICRLLAHYTDIDLGDNSANGFDQLNQFGLINLIISSIPEKEYQEWDTIIHMVEDDEMENVRSFAGYIDTKLETLSLLVSALAEDENFKNTISDKIVQFQNQEG